MDYGHPPLTEKEIERNREKKDREFEQRMKEEKKRILKMVMSLGHSEQEAKELLEKMGDAFCKKFMQLVHEENARLRKNEFSKNKKSIPKSLLKERLGHSGK